MHCAVQVTVFLLFTPSLICAIPPDLWTPNTTLSAKDSLPRCRLHLTHNNIRNASSGQNPILMLIKAETQQGSPLRRASGILKTSKLQIPPIVTELSNGGSVYLSSVCPPHREQQEERISLWSGGKLCLIYIRDSLEIHTFFNVLLRHSWGELSTAKVTRCPLQGREL